MLLRPPVEVMQPVPVPVLPAEDALPGGTQYTIKLDGIRATAHILEGHEVRLVSRRGNELGDRFPQLPPALAVLPVGLVLDGEIVAYERTGAGPGRLDFTALLRSPRGRAAAGTQVLYVAWDALALPGRDIRDRPLRERWQALEMALTGARPPLQLCMATTSRTEAADWYRGLQPLGIEGIVAKGLDTPYRPTHGASAWLVDCTNSLPMVWSSVRKAGLGPARRPARGDPPPPQVGGDGQRRDTPPNSPNHDDRILQLGNRPDLRRRQQRMR